MFKNLNRRTYNNYLCQLYLRDLLDIKNPDKKDKTDIPVINATFQITDDCCCACTYCYQTHKGHKMMSYDTVEKCVDLLFDIYGDASTDFMNPDYNVGIILEFIGGEPLMNIGAIDKCCTYFYEKCIALHHPWAITWQANMISNGTHYFKKEFQKFLCKFNGHVMFNVTIDGPKEMHDNCRKYHDGTGNFEDAWRALTTYKNQYHVDPPTKVTIAPENLNYLGEIVEFFYENKCYNIYANTINEHNWTEDEGAIYYDQLKTIADYLLSNDIPDNSSFSLFDEFFYHPQREDDLQSWCGGDGRMIAFDPDGKVFPCIRYMESSLNGTREPICIGDCQNGLYCTDKQKEFKNALRKATRRTETTDECFYCPISTGCSHCLAWGYQLTGELGKRSNSTCNMHKAASLATSYFWNNYYIKNNIEKRFHLWLPEKEALKFISKEELDMLRALEKKKE